MKSDGWILGLDIGGTFTDAFMLDPASGRAARFKSLTTPDDPARGALATVSAALDEAGIGPHALKILLHATTLVSNALIERKGARTALVTTRGFRDSLEIAREKKYDIYDILLEKPVSLVPRERRFEVTERMAADGTVLEDLDPDSVTRAAAAIRDSGAEALAVCLLHSYINPSHERKLRTLLKRELPGIAITLSSDVLPEIREYERATTATANAYVQPLTAEYLSRFVRGLRSRRVPAGLFVMLSSGGIATPDVARRFPVRICESGPAAGTITAATIGDQIGRDRILSFDMGGTTAKACLIHGGTPLVTTEFEVARVYRFKKGSGLPLKIPVVDLIEIGAGGGSIARVDSLGLLKVGPDSAAADPGPACYDRGGTLPTVTDADLVLGYLDPANFLGGRMGLSRAKAEAAINRHIARPLGLGLHEAALGIHAVVNENMANAIRIHAAEQGFDAADHALVAFGGAGPVHAYDVARRLGVGTVVVPPSAGLGSAIGLLLAPRAYHLARSYAATLDEIDWKRVNRIFAELTREATAVLRRAGVPARDITLARGADMRYLGQRKELAIDLPTGTFGAGKAAAIRRAFETQYEQVYRRIHDGHAVEALCWRLVASGPPITDSDGLDAARPATVTGAVSRKRPAVFPGSYEAIACPVHDRGALASGKKFRGPALVEEAESTIVIGPGASVAVDSHGNLMIALPRTGGRNGAKT